MRTGADIINGALAASAADKPDSARSRQQDQAPSHLANGKRRTGVIEINSYVVRSRQERCAVDAWQPP
jgi:hypothetical protein